MDFIFAIVTGANSSDFDIYTSITAAGIVLDKPFLDHKWDETVKLQMVNVRSCLLRTS
jgi:hypothetical protein